MAPDTKVPDGQTAGRTDNAKTISLHLWRGIKNILTMVKFLTMVEPNTLIKGSEGTPERITSMNKAQKAQKAQKVPKHTYEQGSEGSEGIYEQNTPMNKAQKAPINATRQGSEGTYEHLKSPPKAHVSASHTHTSSHAESIKILYLSLVIKQWTVATPQNRLYKELVKLQTASRKF
ncbi:hypothetical protein DPMN_004900 [Dreissena polymorpha]|uniref:Uncharacterized protein n=1 Tax=Dreissena polymorpha TaxID=45954 RepID=A0A9D4RW30_DREPO|nr:hypothetical protein DPMN_004900 [Dreissena polymorpha]